MSEIDERILTGLREQLAARRALLDRGERPIGWKIGFNAPAAREKLGTDRPLVGFLLESRRLPDGAQVPIGDWENPVFEAEIAVHLGADVPGDATRDGVRAAVAGLSAAIELADLAPPPEDVATIFAGNIYHRHVVLGPVDESRRDGEGITGRVLSGDLEILANDDPAALTGEILEVVRDAAEQLAAAGEALRAGDVVITGAVVPPEPLAPGQTMTADLGPLGRLRVELTE